MGSVVGLRENTTSKRRVYLITERKLHHLFFSLALARSRERGGREKGRTSEYEDDIHLVFNI